MSAPINLPSFLEMRDPQPDRTHRHDRRQVYIINLVCLCTQPTAIYGQPSPCVCHRGCSTAVDGPILMFANLVRSSAGLVSPAHMDKSGL